MDSITKEETQYDLGYSIGFHEGYIEGYEEGKLTTTLNSEIGIYNASLADIIQRIAQYDFDQKTELIAMLQGLYKCDEVADNEVVI